MNDLLGEALARLDRTKAPNIYRPDIEPIVAAARNWQALSNPSNELIEPTPRMWEVLNAAAAFGHPGGSQTLWNELQEAAIDVKSGTRYKIVLVDALTDTAEPETEETQ